MTALSLSRWLTVLLLITALPLIAADKEEDPDDVRKREFGTLLMGIPSGVAKAVEEVQELRMELREDELKNARRGRELDAKDVEKQKKEMEESYKDLKKEVDKELSGVRRDLDRMERKRVRLKEREYKAKDSARDRLAEEIRKIDEEMREPKAIEDAVTGIYETVRAWGRDGKRSDSIAGKVDQELPRIIAEDADGKIVDVHKLAGENGMLITFWNEENRDSLQAARQLLSMQRDLQKKGYTVVLAYVALEGLATARDSLGSAAKDVQMIRVEPNHVRENLRLKVLPLTVMTVGGNRVHSVFYSSSYGLKSGVGDVLDILEMEAELNDR